MAVAIVLVLTGFLLIVWIYRGIMGPLNKMRVAARRIQTGDLDFEIPTEADDELGQLSRDLEDMRQRLKDTSGREGCF